MDDKLDNHDPFRAGDDDLCNSCTVGFFSADSVLSLVGRDGIDLGDDGMVLMGGVALLCLLAVTGEVF